MMNHMPQVRANEVLERQANLNPVQWNQALGMARKLCSDVFQEGGSPKDAVATYGPMEEAESVIHWGQAVNLIAFSMYAPRRSAFH